MLKVGDKAPQFTLQNDAGETVSSAQLTDKPVVLFFYPKDDTPGCTIECKEFRDYKEKFAGKAHIFGISPDDLKSHQAFRDKFELNFPLLSDPGHLIADQFGVWGKTAWEEGILRSTFVIQHGVIAQAFENVKPLGHADQVLATLS